MREDEIDLLELFRALLHRKFIIILVTLVTAIAAGVYCFGFMQDEFTAKTTLYVLNQQNKDTISSSDLTASASLVADYREIILSARVTERVKQELALRSLNAFDISVTAKNNTRIIEISVTGKDAAQAAAVANGLATSFSEAAMDIMRVENVSIIDAATVPVSPSGPPRKKYVVLAALAAAVLTMGVVVVIELMNKSIRTVQDVEAHTGLSVLAQFAEITDNRGRR
ncbi:MAG: YveK family protein [Candidatus Spyradocola sp.]